jgi:hypothetical protein
MHFRLWDPQIQVISGRTSISADTLAIFLLTRGANMLLQAYIPGWVDELEAQLTLVALTLVQIAAISTGN